MTEELDNKYIEDSPEDSPVMDGYLRAQAMLDRFVEINYETAIGAYRSNVSGNEIDAAPISQQIVDIIRNNPPLATLPSYFRDGRVNYLWYSDFYDDAGKEVFKTYRQFASTLPKITPTNYKAELGKIDLPYFKELVNLISLEKLYTEAKRRLAAAAKKAASETTASISVVEQAEEDIAVEIPQPKLPIEKPKRSYEPKLSNEQYLVLAECVEKIKLFRRPVTAAGLKKLFNGRLTEPLQVMKQLSLVYLLDEMRNCGYIKKAWMTVAFENKDFISFRTPGMERKHGSGPHYLTMDQLKSRRSDGKRSYIHGWEKIDQMIVKMRECRDK